MASEVWTIELLLYGDDPYVRTFNMPEVGGKLGIRFHGETLKCL